MSAVPADPGAERFRPEKHGFRKSGHFALFSYGSPAKSIISYAPNFVNIEGDFQRFTAFSRNSSHVYAPASSKASMAAPAAASCRGSTHRRPGARASR